MFKADKSVIAYSEKISYFFTSEEYDLYFSLQQTEATSINTGLYFFPKRSGMHSFMSGITLRIYARQIKQLTSHIDVFVSLRNANLHAMSVRRQLQAAFLNFKFLFIHSLK